MIYICIYMMIGVAIGAAIDLISLSHDKGSELLKLKFGTMLLLVMIEAAAWPVVIYKMIENQIVYNHMRKDGEVL